MRRRSWNRRVAFAILAALALGAGGLRGQGPGLFEMYAARKEMGRDPVFGGMAVGGYRGAFGVRLNAALHLTREDPNTSQNDPIFYCDRFGCWRVDEQAYHSSMLGIGIGAWTIDADLLFAPFRSVPVAKALLLGFSPYAFVGVGGAGVNATDVPDTAIGTLSYGVGAQHDLLAPVGITVEARHRSPFGSRHALTLDSRRDWEYRVAVTLSFGKRKASPEVIVAKPVPPAPAGIVEHVPLLRPEQPPSVLAAQIIDAADACIGMRYGSGGASPTTGFDAAGFVQYVFAEVGIHLPRSERELADAGVETSTHLTALRPGDLLFFAADSGIDHVAVYAGNRRIIHASSQTGTVSSEILGEGERGSWLAGHLVLARSILGR